MKFNATRGKMYPETEVLRQVSGVGATTALTFVLVIADPQQFSYNRSADPYLRLVCKRDNSGESDPDPGISKYGNPYLRRLLYSLNYPLCPLS